eukprot:COSAG05_NODE_72_length_21963_cov_153.494535_14_plen_82_part_00
MTDDTVCGFLCRLESISIENHASIEIAVSRGRVGIVPAIMEGVTRAVRGVRGVRRRVKISGWAFLEDGATSSGESLPASFL